MTEEFISGSTVFKEYWRHMSSPATCGPWLRTRCRRWLEAENGTAAVEFVVLLPFVIGLLGLISWASVSLAVASDVQQLAHELARSALPVADSETWCDDIKSRMVLPLASNLPLLDPGRVHDVNCAIDPDTRLLTVDVSYDAQGTLGSFLGAVIGLHTDSFRRASFVQL